VVCFDRFVQRLSHFTRLTLTVQDLIPSSRADTIIHYGSRCYSGQFSNDGNFFFSCGQDFKVRMYDTSNPYSWRYYKVVDNPYGQWTITDASLSPDNKFLAYSSISRIVCLAPTDPADNSTPRTLDFSRMSPGSGGRWGHRGYSHFGIWSIRFSGDGREIVAGTGDRSVYVFDIERNMSILRIPGHDDDVNAVCFGDQNSPHILYSGSDDTTLKVWDRRSMGDGRAAGVFLGHTEGLTYVDSKGDGRYIISNGKDQTAKLWDLRKVMPTEDADKININRYTTGFEYRMNSYDVREWKPHPYDCSLVTFRGHQVLKTLIRCHFSPPGSTDSRYVYSGSYDGKVYIWNLDATLKDVIDVGKATEHLRTRERRDYEDGFWGQSGFQTCVRDASWHPDVPMIAGTFLSPLNTLVHILTSI
jgi:WD repeat-containing protein 23